MPINVISRKFWSQSKNGKLFNENVSDFTDYLLGTIGEKIKRHRRQAPPACSPARPGSRPAPHASAGSAPA